MLKYRLKTFTTRLLSSTSLMAFSLSLKTWFLATVLISISATFCYSVEDPAQMVAKALLCFNNQMIYVNCSESYRLTETGNLNVSREATDQYCNGPCYAETELVLTCVNNILVNFEFYNKATVKDVQDTIDAACSNTNQRGNFDVAEHIQGENSQAYKRALPMYMYMMAMVIGAGVLP